LLGKRGELARPRDPSRAGAERRELGLFGAIWFVVHFVGLITQQPTPKPMSVRMAASETRSWSTVLWERGGLKGGGASSLLNAKHRQGGEVVVGVEIEATAKSLRK
jgi:hypothetical protein